MSTARLQAIILCGIVGSIVGGCVALAVMLTLPPMAELDPDRINLGIGRIVAICTALGALVGSTIRIGP